MRGFPQDLLQRCISRRSETYKTGDMGLTKTFREFNFLFLHQSACAKKPCKNNSTYRNGFINKSYQCLCSAGFKGRTRDEGNIRLHVISFMEQMSVFPSVTILVWSCISGKWGLIEMNRKKTNQQCWCISKECYALYESNWNQVLNFNTLYTNEVESRRHKRVYRGNIQLQRWCCVQQY